MATDHPFSQLLWALESSSGKEADGLGKEFRTGYAYCKAMQLRQVVQTSRNMGRGADACSVRAWGRWSVARRSTWPKPAVGNC